MNKELKANIDTLILKYFDYIEEEKLKECVFAGMCDICLDYIHIGDKYKVVVVKNKINGNKFKILWVCQNCLRRKRGK